MAIDAHKPTNLGFTGKVGGSLKDRSFVTAKDADGRVYIVGENVEDRKGWIREHKATRNLKPLKHPKRNREDRSVTVTRNGRTFTLTSQLRDPQREARDREYERRLREMEYEASKRRNFVKGAEYAETWQSHDSTVDDDTPKVAYYFRDKYYNSLDEYLAAIDAIG